MSKIKKVLVSIVISVIVFSSLSVICFAGHNQVSTTYLNFSSSFLSSHSNCWDYPHVGYRYRDSSCAAPNAYFDVSIRRYNNSSTLIYYTVKTYVDNPGNMPANIWCGNMAQNVGKPFPYVYKNYYTIHNNNGNNIHAKIVELFSRDYVTT